MRTSVANEVFGEWWTQAQSFHGAVHCSDPPCAQNGWVEAWTCDASLSLKSGISKNNKLPCGSEK